MNPNELRRGGLPSTFIGQDAIKASSFQRCERAAAAELGGTALPF